MTRQSGHGRVLEVSGGAEASGAGSEATDRTTLEKERQFLLVSLRDLEAERAAGEMDATDYRSLRDGYTARAAAVLRALEGAASTPRPAAAAGALHGPTRSPRRPRRRRRSRAAALGVAAAIVAVTGAMLVGSSGGRGMGQPVSGSIPTGASGRIAQALELERMGKAVDALKLYDGVLAEDPRNVEALAYRGWLLKRAGLPDEAMASLDGAVRIDPRYPDAHFFRGMVLYQDRSDPAGAVEEFKAFLANDPPQAMVAMVTNVMQRAMAEAAAQKPPPGR